MLRLTARRREVLSDKLLDLANPAAAALVFGQFVGQQPLSWRVLMGGMAVWLVLATTSFWLTGER